MNRINRLQTGQTLQRLFLIGLSILLLSITQIAQAGEHYPACNRGDKLITSVTNANGNGEEDYIGLVGPGCTYTVDKTLVIKADGGQPVTIEGNGSVISGGDKVQVFNVEPGAVLILQNVTIQQGKSKYGGAIYNKGTLTLTGTTLYSNRAEWGGGLYASEGDVVLNNSTVQGNTADYGGGIFQYDGYVTLNSSFVTLNEAKINGGGIQNAGKGKLIINNGFLASNHAKQDGGGIHSNTSQETKVNNTRVDSNSADSLGGGIYVHTGYLTMTGSTLLLNSAVNNGGGLYNAANGQSYTTNNTITQNTADYGAGIHNDGKMRLTNATVSFNTAAKAVGGLLNAAGSIDLVDTILSHNVGEDCGSGATLTVWGRNLVADGTCNLPETLSGNPGFGSLTGASEFAPVYYPLLTGSQAIDAGATVNCATVDQRGAPRPMDGNGDGIAACDIGAFEADTVAPSVTFTPTSTDPGLPGMTATPTMTETPGGPTKTPTAPITPTAPAEEPGVELLTNGGFEQRDANQKAVLAPWTVKNGSGDKVKCNAQYSKDGTCAFRFKGSATENAKLGQNVKLDTFTFAAGQKLDLSAFVATDSLSVSGKIKLSVKYTDNALSPDKLSMDLRSTNGYEKLGGQVTLKSGSVAKIKLQINHRSANGKLFVDSVSVKQQSVESMLLPLP